jgi:hypothetical protein
MPKQKMKINNHYKKFARPANYINAEPTITKIFASPATNINAG